MDEVRHPAPVTSLDDRLRGAFESLADRVRDDVGRHARELVEQLASVAEAERADAVAEAAKDAWSAAERDTSERLAAGLAAAEREASERLNARLAAAEREASERSNARLAAAEREASEQLNARLAAVEREASEQLNARLAAVEREASERSNARLAAAEREASERLATELAAAEREAAARLTSSVAAAEARTRDEVRQELQQESERARQQAIAETTGREQQERAAATARILTAVQTMDRAQSLSDVLQALADAASGQARRLVIFLVKGARLQAWRLVGFDAVAPDSPLEIATSESGLIGEAARSGNIAKTGTVPAFANLPPDRPAVAIPLAISRQPLAVLYADQGPAGDITQAAWSATLEILGRHAARSLEALTAVRLAQVASSRSPVVTSNVAN